MLVVVDEDAVQGIRISDRDQNVNESQTPSGVIDGRRSGKDFEIRVADGRL